MTKKNTPQTIYTKWIKKIAQRFRATQVKAALKINSTILEFYCSVGRDISARQSENSYGVDFFTKVSNDLKRKLPEISCFSPRNLRYMEKFYHLYCKVIKILPQAGAKLYNIPWGHAKQIIDKFFAEPEKAIFYVQKTIENGWSRAVLLNMLDSGLFEKQGKATHNFEQTLPDEQSELAKDIIKDPYNFNFLALSENYKELDLQQALEQNLYRYLMELGKGFAFVGRQVRIEVNGDEFFCDQLFYHTKLHCYVVVELKVIKFEPEFVSKLNFYCNAVNHLIKSDTDGDTIGLLICKEKNDLVAQWTVEKSQEPIAISKYELKNLITKGNGNEFRK